VKNGLSSGYFFIFSSRLDPENFCKNNYWYIPRQHIPNCTSTSCPVEEVILEYARENLVSM
jgi:hypothetical protein